MNTDELIALLAEDAPGRGGRAGGPGGNLTGGLRLALVTGAALSALLFLGAIGIRADMGAALQTPRVMFKVGLTLVLAVTACGLVFRIGKPGVALAPATAGLALPVALLACGMAAELFVVPASGWRAALVGRYAYFCLIAIPLLSLAPLAGFLWALRGGAPASPTLAGAAAGLAAGAIGAALYAWHCPDDSPLFVAVWYLTAIALVTLGGGAAGRVLLRW